MDDHDPADRLTHCDGQGPSLHILNASASEAYDLAQRLSARPKTVARVLRGTRCRTAHGLFDEFAAAFQFPPYFGANWNALNDCLGDLEWLAGESYVVVVTDASEVLVECPAQTFRLFLHTLTHLP